MYFMLAYFAFTQGALGPIMPFLGDELDLSYTVRGFHLSALALGMVLAGLSADRFSRLIGRWRLFWLGSLAMGISAILFIIGSRPEVTILACLLMGVTGGQMLVMIQAILSDVHGERRAIALSEANVTAAIGASAAPLLVGGLERIDLSWRGTLIVTMIAWWFLYGLFRGAALPRAQYDEDDDTETATSSTALPRIYWAYAFVIFLSVSIEWSMLFWGADFLENGIGMARDNAVSAMVIYFVAIPIGRAFGSGLARRFTAQQLLLSAFAMIIIGFFPFWLVRWIPLNLLALFVTGIGVANLFPLGLSVASSVVPPRLSDAASGRVSLSAGAAILIAPQILGSLADQTGISAAFGVVAMLSVAAMGVMFRANQMQLTNP